MKRRASSRIAGGAGAGEADAPCVREDGKTPVVEAGRERDVRRLFVPHVVGEAMAIEAGWTFKDVLIEADAISALLVGPGGAQGRLRLRPRLCWPEAPEPTASFAWRYEGDPGGHPVAMALIQAVRIADKGDFYRTWVDTEPPQAQAPETGKATPSTRAGGAEAGRALPPELPWNRTHLALGLLLAAALLLWLVLGFCIRVRAGGRHFRCYVYRCVDRAVFLLF